MMLHLLDAAGPQAMPATCACLNALKAADPAARAVLFGGAKLRQMAGQVGLQADAVFAPPLAKPWLNLHACRARAAQVCPGGPHAITAWSIDALLFARLAWPKVPARLVLLEAPAPAQWQLLTWLNRWRPFSVQTPRALLAGGALAGAPAPLTPDPCDLPAIPTAPPLPPAARPHIALLGLRANAWRGASVLGIAEAARGILPGMPPRTQLRLHPRQPGLAHATRLVCGLGQPDRLHPTPAMEAPWLLPDNCRSVLVLANPRGPDTTQTLVLPWLAGQNRPLIAEDTSALRALLEKADRVHWVKAGDLPALAHACGQAMM